MESTLTHDVPTDAPLDREKMIQRLREDATENFDDGYERGKSEGREWAQDSGSLRHIQQVAAGEAGHPISDFLIENDYLDRDVWNEWTEHAEEISFDKGFTKGFTEAVEAAWNDVRNDV